MFERSHARDTIRNSTRTGYLARSRERGFVTGMRLDLAVYGTRVVTRPTLLGEMSASAASPTTCRHQNLRRPWTSLFIGPKSGEPPSCAPKPCHGVAIAQ